MDGLLITFVPPQSGKRPTRAVRTDHSRRRQQATDLSSRPHGVVVPTDMFWDELLGELCYISEEHAYRVSLAAYHEDRTSGVVAKVHQLPIRRAEEDFSFADARAAE